MSFKVGGRIIEGQMPVFSDSSEADIDRMLTQNITNPAALGCSVFLSVDVVEGGKGEGELRNEALPQVFTERGRMGDGDAHIFIEVKSGDAGPINPRLDREVIDHGELGGSCSDDDVGPAFSLKGLTDTLGAEFGGGGPHFLWGRKDAEVDGCFIFHKIQWAFCWGGGGKQESRKWWRLFRRPVGEGWSMGGWTVLRMRYYRGKLYQGRVGELLADDSQNTNIH